MTRLREPGSTVEPGVLPDGLEPRLLEQAKVLLCDADGSLFPSEEPAFDASTVVTNRFMAEHGSAVRFEAEQLRLATTGKNFRTTIVDLATRNGLAIMPGELEQWVAEEKRVVSAHLGEALRPDPEVQGALRTLAGRYRLVIVSSSALTRLDACLNATGLAELFPPEVRFSAEDSLPVPASKPDPAVYRHAGESLGISAWQAVAIEDAVPGVQSARAAGFTSVGLVRFVPAVERAERARQLTAAGAATVVPTWADVVSLLL